MSKPILILLLAYPQNGVIKKCIPGPNFNSPFPPLGSPAIIRVCELGAQAFSGNVTSFDLLNHTYTVTITGPLNDYHPNSINNDVINT